MMNDDEDDVSAKKIITKDLDPFEPPCTNVKGFLYI